MAAHINASQAPLDTLSLTLDLKALPTSKEAAARFVEALTKNTTLRIPRGVMLARSAQALAEIGALDAATKIATRALSSLDGLAAMDRTDVIGSSGLALTIAGKEPPAVVSESADPITKLYIAQGLARSGRKDRARVLLAKLGSQRTTPLQGAQIMALVWLGDIDAARAIVDASDAGARMQLIGWFAQALADSKHPQAKALIDGLLVPVSELAAKADTPQEVYMMGVWWSELVWYREKLDAASGRAARTKLHDWLLARQDERRELFGINAVRATSAGNLAEAARLEPITTAIAKMEIAFIRGDLDRGLDALAEHVKERASLLAQTMTVPPSSSILDGFENAEATAWLILAARTSVDHAIVDRFRAITCTKL